MTSGIQVKYYKLIIGPKEGGKYPLSESFKKHVFSHAKYPDRKIIHYIGDEKEVIQFPHGNARKFASTQRSYYRTNPDVLEKLKKSKKNPAKVYSQMKKDSTRSVINQRNDAVRNLDQVKNCQKSERNKIRISHDAFYNIVEQKLEYGDFISDFRLFPNFIVVGYYKEILDKFQNLLGREDLPAMELSYDTTFNLGDFYVSFLIFKETEFLDMPIIPLFYFIHDRKLQVVHEIFFQFVADMIPQLKEDPQRVFLVCDNEIAICNALASALPLLDNFRCWRHVQKNCYDKLQKVILLNKEEKKRIVAEHMLDVRGLFESSSRQSYEDKLLKHACEWNMVPTFTVPIIHSLQFTL